MEHSSGRHELFVKTFEADSKYPSIVANWSVFYLYTGDYMKAKNADEAIKMGYRFGPDYLEELEIARKERYET
jgi:hypothetical protein